MRSSYPFTYLPTQWIRQGDLGYFYGAGQRGVAITALKLYIAVLCHTRTDNLGPGIGRAQLTFDQIQEITDVARAMIRPALEFLTPWVSTTSSPTGNVYEIRQFTTHPGAWVRFPSAYVLKQGALAAFDARQATSLAALKMYLYLLERCERHSNFAVVSYGKIRQMTRIAQNDIRRASGMLHTADLIRVHPSSDPTLRNNPGYNRYEILGLGALIESDEQDVAGEVDFA
jgi:hypothetical protein